MKIILAILILSVYANDHILLNQEYHQYINSVQNTWISGHNPRWLNFTQEQLLTQTGTILDVPEYMQLPLKLEESLEGLPESFDSREAWPNCESLREIRDQSTCGSCWAIAAAEVMSDRLCIESAQQLQTRISTQDLLTCCGFTCGFGCNGGLQAGAWHYFKQTGIVTGDLYDDNQWCRPYGFAPCDHHVEGKYRPCDGVKPTPQCVKECHPESGRIYREDKIKAEQIYSIPATEEAIMTEIIKNGPVEASFSVYQDFLTYRSGIYQHVDESSPGGHSVKIIGWGVENGVRYWLCVNSWNEDWGENGLFRILRGVNHCGIEGQINAGKVRL